MLHNACVRESYPRSSGPVRLAIIDSLNVRKSRCHNYPPRWNGAPDQELLVILRNHRTGELSHPPRWGFIAYFCAAPKGGRKPINAKCVTVRTLPTSPSIWQVLLRGHTGALTAVRRWSPAFCQSGRRVLLLFKT